MTVCIHETRVVPMEARRWGQVTQNSCYRQLGDTPRQCLELKPGFLEEQAFSTADCLSNLRNAQFESTSSDATDSLQPDWSQGHQQAGPGNSTGKESCFETACLLTTDNQIKVTLFIWGALSGDLVQITREGPHKMLPPSSPWPALHGPPSTGCPERRRGALTLSHTQGPPHLRWLPAPETQALLGWLLFHLGGMTCFPN